MLFHGQAKVNSFRRDLETGLEQLGQQVRFTSEPFITRKEGVGSVVRQFEAGALTLAEASLALGYPPTPNQAQQGESP